MRPCRLFHHPVRAGKLPLLTKNQVAIRVAAIVALAELLIVMVMGGAQDMGAPTGTFLNVALLMAVSTPAIYLLVIKPFVDARDEALTQISHLAFTDPLTQLANRRLLMEHLEKLIAGSIRHRIHGALLLIDLDGFKAVNDTNGHGTGDALLVGIARRIQTITRTEDIIARLGGDEFVVLINHLGNDEKTARDKAMRVAGKIVDAVTQPFDFDGKTFRVGASIGIRLIGFQAADTDTAIREADIAMYRAKRGGEGCVVFHGG